MNGNGQVRQVAAGGEALRWTGRVLSAEDLRYSLNGHRELILPARTIITPLAAEQIRTQGLRVQRLPVEKQTTPAAAWGYAQERPDSVVRNAVRALEREGVSLPELTVPDRSSPCRWARTVAESVASGGVDPCRGGVIFCDDAGLLCCVANKVAGLRAVVANTVPQAARATLALGANLVAVEMPGRTFFEVRQILRTLCASALPACPAGVACILEELDGHAHR
jgi:ribose 5-phosphate isomerase RpiB